VLVALARLILGPTVIDELQVSSILFFSSGVNTPSWSS
jgi:hypothetical protein